MNPSRTPALLQISLSVSPRLAARVKMLSRRLDQLFVVFMLCPFLNWDSGAILRRAIHAHH